MDDERQRLAATFDRAADLYQRARPEYPSELYDRLLQITQLSPGARLLEIGCATGKATLPLAQRGFRITCVEPGAALAAAARENLTGFDVDVVEARFEDWTPAGEPLAMVFAATSWHLIEPTERYPKAADLLEPRGYLALWGAGHVIPYDGDPFFEELQEVYDEISESLPTGATLPRPQRPNPGDRDTPYRHHSAGGTCARQVLNRGLALPSRPSGQDGVLAWCQAVPSRGSRTITGVSVDRRPA